MDRLISSLVSAISEYYTTTSTLMRWHKLRSQTGESSDAAHVTPVAYFAISFTLFLVTFRYVLAHDPDDFELQAVRSSIGELSISETVAVSLPALLTLLFVGRITTLVLRDRLQRAAMRTLLIYATGLLLFWLGLLLVAGTVLEVAKHWLRPVIPDRADELLLKTLLILSVVDVLGLVVCQLWFAYDNLGFARRLMTVAWRTVIVIMAPIAAIAIYIGVAVWVQDQGSDVRVLPLGHGLVTFDSSGRMTGLQVDVFVDNQTQNAVVLRPDYFAVHLGGWDEGQAEINSVPRMRCSRLYSPCWDYYALMRVVNWPSGSRVLVLNPHETMIFQVESVSGIGPTRHTRPGDRSFFVHMLYRRTDRRGSMLSANSIWKD